MPSVGFDTWFTKKCTTAFIVRNIAPNNKRIKIFSYPIKNGMERDLLDIPFVSEADIRHSLLKGELLTKIRSNEIIVTYSNIDLLQFDDCQKAFLQSAGVYEGLEVSGGIAEIPFTFKQGVDLIGDMNGTNAIFTTPDKFINGNIGNNSFRISIKHNGRELLEGSDFLVSESGGSGTGYDTIIFKCTLPDENSILIVDYVVETT